MAGEDARLLHELDSIAEEDITNLDDFQCYVKLSLAGRRLPVFSLDLDAPPRADEEVARYVTMRSQQRDSRPVGIVDDLIRQGRVRHRHIAAPPRPSRRKTSEAVGETGEERESGTRRKKRRGGSSRSKEERTPMPEYLHLMYDEEDEPETNHHEHGAAREDAGDSPA